MRYPKKVVTALNTFDELLASSLIFSGNPDSAVPVEALYTTGVLRGLRGCIHAYQAVKTLQELVNIQKRAEILSSFEQKCSRLEIQNEVERVFNDWQKSPPPYLLDELKASLGVLKQAVVSEGTDPSESNPHLPEQTEFRASIIENYLVMLEQDVPIQEIQEKIHADLLEARADFSADAVTQEMCRSLNETSRLKVALSSASYIFATGVDFADSIREIHEVAQLGMSLSAAEYATTVGILSPVGSVLGVVLGAVTTAANGYAWYRDNELLRKIETSETVTRAILQDHVSDQPMLFETSLDQRMMEVLIGRILHKNQTLESMVTQKRFLHQGGVAAGVSMMVGGSVGIAYVAGSVSLGTGIGVMTGGAGVVVIVGCGALYLGHKKYSRHLRSAARKSNDVEMVQVTDRVRKLAKKNPDPLSSSRLALAHVEAYIASKKVSENVPLEVKTKYDEAVEFLVSITGGKDSQGVSLPTELQPEKARRELQKIATAYEGIRESKQHQLVSLIAKLRGMHNFETTSFRLSELKADHSPVDPAVRQAYFLCRKVFGGRTEDITGRELLETLSTQSAEGRLGAFELPWTPQDLVTFQMYPPFREMLQVYLQIKEAMVEQEVGHVAQQTILRFINETHPKPTEPEIRKWIKTESKSGGVIRNAMDEKRQSLESAQDWPPFRSPSFRHLAETLFVEATLSRCSHSTNATIAALLQKASGELDRFPKLISGNSDF